jgi:heat shock protein HslJ
MLEKFIFLCFSLIFLRCNNSSLSKSKSSSVTHKAKTVIQNKNFKNGTDYYAEGSTPTTWKLLINIDDSINFIASDGLQLTFPYSSIHKDDSNGVKVFSGNIKNNNIKILLYLNNCSIVDTYDKKLKYSSFHFNDKIYTGCGGYITNPNLAGKWVLHTVNGKHITGKNDQTPDINFNLTKEKLNGQDDCGNIESKFQVQGDRILFAPIKFSGNCNNLELRKTLKEKVSGKLVNYYFQNNFLHFSLIDDSEIVFKKAM